MSAAAFCSACRSPLSYSGPYLPSDIAVDPCSHCWARVEVLTRHSAWMAGYEAGVADAMARIARRKLDHSTVDLSPTDQKEESLDTSRRSS